MAQIHGGKIIARALKEEGVKYIFTLCGTSVTPIYDGCLDYGIEIIDVRNEQSASYMADAWGRLTGEPGICVTTSGPGYTNALTGVATAYFADSPMILISGHCESNRIDMYGFQEMDQVGMAKPITKWSRLVRDTAKLPLYMSYAFREALTGRPGPVHLSITSDALLGTCNEEEITFLKPTQYRSCGRVRPDPSLVNEALELLLNAKRPAIIAGTGVRWAEAGRDLLKFCGAMGIPFFTKEDAHGDINEVSPLYFGVASLRSNGAARKLAEADVIMALGLKFDVSLNCGEPPNLSLTTKVIHVDIDPAQIGRNRPVEVGIIADVKSVLEEMIYKCDIEDEKIPHERVDTSWVNSLRESEEEFRSRWKEEVDSNEEPIHPLRLLREIEPFIGENDSVVVDGGDIGQWCKVARYSRHPRHWLTVGPIGGVGCGVPFAIAAQLARPEHRTILISGDGSFGFGAMEFDIAVKRNLPIVAVISNDTYWGIIRHPQIQRFGKDRAVATSLGLTRFDKVIESLGGHGEFVKRPEQVAPAMRQSLSSELPSCVNVMVKFTNPLVNSH